MQQVSVLETNIGSSTTGNSANTQIIFNDNGTLRGDAQFTWNKTLNRLTVDGDETISGDLTVAANTLKVDSTNDRVGIGTATPYALLHANGTIAAANFDWTPSFIAPTVGLLAASNSSSASIRIATLDSNPTHDPFVNFLTSGGQNWSIGIDNSDSDKFKIAFTNGFTGSNEVFAVDTSAVFSWYDGAGGTRMTLNSTGLGVGGSPAGTFPVILVEGGAGTYAKFNSKVGAKTWSTGYRSGTTQFEIQEDGTERFVIANGGNVGVGVTPSAWGGGGRAFEIGFIGTGIQSRNNQYSALTQNSWFNSSAQWIYGATGLASRYDQDAGTHKWFIAPSGTAGNAITFTQAMTLDASGNLILQSSATPATLTVNGQLTVNATSNTNLRFSYRGSDGTTRVANITLA
jgi:hypothetical protein